MEHTALDVLEERPGPGTAARDIPHEASGGDRASAVESDPTVIIAALRGEMDRVCVTNDSSCICIISPDGAVDARMMDALCEWIMSSLRGNDTLYRFADDKYLVLLPQVDRAAAVKLIKRLRDNVLSESLPSAGGDRSTNITASFGGTMLDSRVPLHEHMDRASEAHSWALKGMGDTICMWTPKF